MVSSSLIARPRLAPHPALAASIPCRISLAAARGARALTVSVRCQAQARRGDIDAHYMRRCVELAPTAAGHTSPNPIDYCVVDREDRIIREGFHPGAGYPHA